MKSRSTTAVLHYSAPPVVGGVETVILAHARLFQEAGFPFTVIAGRGQEEALPPATNFVLIPEMDTQHPHIQQAASELEQGKVPENFPQLTRLLEDKLGPILDSFDNVIVHNIFTKHFNLPLTAALFHLLDKETLRNCIAWCHDFTWTSPNSRPKVHPGYPWDLLRTYRPGVNYVTVSDYRRQELAGLLGQPPEVIEVVYNGVNPSELLGLSQQGEFLVERLGLLESDLILLMPVRVTQAKNIEFALKVVAQLKKRGLKPRLVLTGPPDPHDEQSLDYFLSLQSLRSELGIEQEMRFVYESGPSNEQPLAIDLDVVGELYRVSDLLFMPSHREGFGMPVLEAGLVGIPVFSTPIPAAREIGDQDIILINSDDDPASVADQLLKWSEESSVHRLRRRVRQKYTWRSIFKRQIQPLLQGDESQNNPPCQ